jgi:hypothetical protein
MEVGEPTAMFVPAMSGLPVRRRVAVAPFWNPVPAIATVTAAVFGAADGFADDGAGAGATVKHPAQLPDLPSVFVTVMLRPPGAADPAMVRFIVTLVGDENVVELTVTPLPLTAAVAPRAKLVPATSTTSVVPCAREEGTADVTVGALAVIVRQPVHESFEPSGLVTVNDQAPGAAAITSNFADIENNCTWTLVPAMSACPLFRNRAVAPCAKPVPLIVIVACAVLGTFVGEIEMTLGAAPAGSSSTRIDPKQSKHAVATRRARVRWSLSATSPRSRCLQNEQVRSR